MKMLFFISELFLRGAAGGKGMVYCPQARLNVVYDFKQMQESLTNQPSIPLH